jgi:hypothetical protein
VLVRAVEVTGPDEVRWRVRVVWEPRWRALARRFGGWRRKRRGSGPDGAEVVDGALQVGGHTGGGGGGGDFDLGDGIIAGVVIVVVLVVGVAVFWWVLIPMLLLVLDAVVVVALLIAAVIGRVVLRRPWTVEARASDGATLTEDVVGWRAALRRRDEIADRLRLGRQAVDADPFV